VVALVALVLGLVAAAAVVLREPPLSQDPTVAAAQRFLRTYVDRDGRVVRHDQGGDTVSEGQAYALHLAVASGEERTFRRVWRWTAQHLQRPDGLLSWHWADGAVADPQPAADADIDAAHALLLGAERFDDPALRDEALRIAAAVADLETVVAGDRRLLLAGPWAAPTRTLNPSYLDPGVFAALGAATGDPTWAELTASTWLVLDDLLDGVALPADWAVADPSTGTVTPASPPGDPGGPARWSLDAARLPIRLAATCTPEAQRAAARLWPVFADRNPQDIALAHDLGGEPVTGDRHPVTVLAAAAAAAAAGDPDRAQTLLANAESLQGDQPTYYGAAWLALTRVALTACP